MPAKTFTAPRVWKRPYTSVYSDNYRYGNSLYSGAVADIENRSRGYGSVPYSSSYSSGGGSVISDPGVRRAILEAELLTSSDIMQPSSMQSMLNNLEISQQQQQQSSLLNRSTSSSSRNYQLESTTTTISSSRPDAASYTAYTSAKDLAHVESELDESRARRRRDRQGRSLNRPDTMYTMSSYEYDPLITSANHRTTTPPPSAMVNSTAESHLKDWSLERCREIQTEVEHLTNSLGDIETYIKSESSAVRKQLNQDVADLVIVLDEQERTICDMNKSIKKQHRQIDELQSNYENAAKSYTDTLDHLTMLERKANKLCHEIDSMRNMSTEKVQKSCKDTNNAAASVHYADVSTTAASPIADSINSNGYIDEPLYLKPSMSLDNLASLNGTSTGHRSLKMSNSSAAVTSSARASSHVKSVQIITKKRTRTTTSMA